MLLTVLNWVFAGKYEKVTLLAPPSVTVAPGVANTLVPAVTPVTEPDVAIVLQFRLKSVDAGVEALGLSRVTGFTIHQRDRLVVVGMFSGEVGVATDAGIGRVRGQF